MRELQKKGWELVVKTTAAAAPYLKGVEAGWTQSLERLEKLVAQAK